MSEREMFEELIIALVLTVVFLIIFTVVLTFKYADLRSKYEDLAVRCKRVENKLETTEEPEKNYLILEEGGE